MNGNAERKILSFQTTDNKTVTLELLALYPWEGREYGVCREVDGEGNYIPPDRVIFQIVRAIPRDGDYEFTSIQSDMELSAASEGLDALISEGGIILPWQEQEESVIELPDENGEMQEYQIIAVVEYNGRRYAALILLDAFSDNVSLDLPIELRECELTERDGVQGAVFSTIENEQEYDAVADIVAQRIEEMNAGQSANDGLPS